MGISHEVGGSITITGGNVLTKGKYYKGNYIEFKIAIVCAIGGAIGGYIGAKLLKKLPEKILKISFTVFLIYVSFKMITS